MAVVNVESGTITNVEAGVAAKSHAYDSKLRSFSGQCTVTSGDDIASTYAFGHIPSNANVKQLLLYSPDIGTTTIADFGLYQTAANGGAVVDADFFASAVSLKDGVLNASDITHESGAYSIAESEQAIWQALGLSADPGIIYEVRATLTAAADATAVMGVKCYYGM